MSTGIPPKPRRSRVTAIDVLTTFHRLGRHVSTAAGCSLFRRRDGDAADGGGANRAGKFRRSVGQAVAVGRQHLDDAKHQAAGRAERAAAATAARARRSRTSSANSSTASSAAARRSAARPRSAPGFIIDPAGYVVTNNHVIAEADEITVTLADDKRLKAKVVGRDAKTDLALLKVEPETPLRAVTFGDSDGPPGSATGSSPSAIRSGSAARLRPASSRRATATSIRDPTTTSSRPTPPSTAATRAGRCSTSMARSSASTRRSSLAVGRQRRHRLRDPGQPGQADHRSVEEVRPGAARLAWRAHPDRHRRHRPEPRDRQDHGRPGR